MDKIILTDCDGVLLDWEASFERWIALKGYVFNPLYNDQYSINDRYGIRLTDIVTPSERLRKINR